VTSLQSFLNSHVRPFRIINQSACLSWCQTPIWGPRPYLCYCQTAAGLLVWGALSDERTGLSFTISSAVILGSGSHGTHNHILLTQIRDPPTWRPRSAYLYPPGTGWPSYTPRHWVPFSSPPTTHRATVEVFDSALIL
jgi:hypothetical protein